MREQFPGNNDTADAAGHPCDGIINRTGENVRLVLFGGGTPLVANLKDDKKLSFKVRPSTKRVTVVAYKKGTNKLIAVVTFNVIHQKCPPTDFFVLEKTESVVVTHDGEEALAAL